MNSAETGAGDAGEYVLVVDDAPDNIEFLVDILTGAGYHARPASNAESALRCARAQQPALVLLDITMPQIDGFEVCRLLKADARTRDVPVIFLSGLTDSLDMSKGFSLGAVDYIAKPFRAEEVLARVRVHIGTAAAKQQCTTRNGQLQQDNEQATGEIAARKRTSEALRESRDQLDAIILSMGNGIISVDGNQRIVLFNTAAERMFGYAAASVIGQPLSILLPVRFRILHEEHLRRFDASGQSNRTMGTYGLIYGLRANGEEFPVEATVSQSGNSHNKRFSVILRDITDRRQAEQVSEQLIRQLELLSTRLATAQEGERRKIAYALHDDLGQELATLKLYLQMMEKGSDSGQTKTPREQALSMATHATQRIHEMIADLDPPQLEDFGLDAAVRAYCRVQTAAGGWNLHLDAPKPDVRAPRPVERACFRVVQEGLNNVLQHAQASEVWIHVRQDSNKLELVIRDNGIGFDRNAVREDELREDGSLGLFGMQIRAKHAGGSVEIESAPGNGTEVWAVFPLPAAMVEPVRGP